MQVEDIKETRDGRRVRIICIDAKISDGNYDIVGLIKDDKGNDFIEWWNSKNVVEGFIMALSTSSERDIKL